MAGLMGMAGGAAAAGGASTGAAAAGAGAAASGAGAAGAGAGAAGAGAGAATMGAANVAPAASQIVNGIQAYGAPEQAGPQQPAVTPQPSTMDLINQYVNSPQHQRMVQQNQDQMNRRNAAIGTYN